MNIISKGAANNVSQDIDNYFIKKMFNDEMIDFCTSNFAKDIWNDLDEILLNAINYSLHHCDVTKQGIRKNRIQYYYQNVK